MEPKFQTSFIPKKNIEDDSRNRSVNKETDIFSLTATMVFTASILLFGGLFLYKIMLNRQIANLDAELNSARSAIQPEKIKEIVDNSSRINTSLGILESHQATSRLLRFLGDSSIRRMKIDELTYQNRNNAPSVSVTSEAQTYNGLAYQQQVLSESGLISNLVFSEIRLDDNGTIGFKFTGRIDPSLLLYKELIEDSITLNQ